MEACEPGWAPGAHLAAQQLDVHSGPGLADVLLGSIALAEMSWS
jgi:hypothetical protein